MTFEQDPAISLSFVDRPSRLRRDRNKSLVIASRLRWLIWTMKLSLLCIGGSNEALISRVERGFISLRSHKCSHMKARSIFHHSKLDFINHYETVLIPDKPSHLLCVQIWWNQIIFKKSYHSKCSNFLFHFYLFSRLMQFWIDFIRFDLVPLKYLESRKASTKLHSGNRSTILVRTNLFTVGEATAAERDLLINWD